MKKIFTALLLLSAIAATASTVEIVVPFAAGGPSDLVARAAQQYLMAGTAKVVSVVNKPGADGRVAISYVAQHPSDGHTLIMASSGPFLFNNVVYKTLDYDFKDFDIVAPIARTPVAIMVNSKSKITNYQEFVTAAHSEKLNCGVSNSVGDFSAKYLIFKLSLPNTEVIPFKGGKDSLNSLLGGHVDCVVDAVSGYIPSYRAGQIRIIAIASSRKYPEYGDPTVLKDKIPGYVFYSWFGIGISTKTTSVKKDQILSLLQTMHSDPEFKKTMATINLEVTDADMPPAVTRIFIEKEYEHYEAMRKQLGMGKVD